MNKKFFGLALAALSSLSMAATAVVWDGDAEPDMAPAYSFTFDYGTGASIDTTNVNGVKVIDFTAKAGTASNGAGYGFGWKQDAAYKDVAISLASYKGVCMTYKAEQPFRVDFKQSNITDDNFYGAEIAAAAASKKYFIDFSKLSQGWKSSSVVAWNASKQLGVQFGYKNTHATKYGATNTIELEAFVLADECPSFAPVVKDAYASFDGQEIDLNEGEIYELDMADVFEDADGDDLKVTVKFASTTNSVTLVDSAAYNQNSVIQFRTTPNPKGPSTVTITATDPTSKSASFSFIFNTIDSDNAPVAKDCKYEVNEETVLKNSLTDRLTLLGYDADGDALVLELVEETAHGTLDLNTSTGIFSYTPEKDFFGTDAFTYRFVDKNNSESVSNIGTCTIIVKNVNDAPVVTVVTKTFLDELEKEYKFGDTLVVDEDFADFFVMIPEENITIVDADGENDYTIAAKTSGVVNATYSALEGFYGVTISAKPDAFGVAKVSLTVTDPKITVPVDFMYVKVVDVADPPIARDDSYDVIQDSLNTIAAKNGVLANDTNPDGTSKLTAVLEIEPAHGTLVFNKDGSFTYESEEDYEGEDAFGYKVVNEAGLESNMAVVTLNVKYRNKAPKVVVDVATLDTTVEEEFVKNIIYTSKVFGTWFEDPEGDKMTYTAKSDDGKLKVTMNTTTLTIASVKDSIGDAFVTVTATDVNKNASSLKIHVTILNKNDPPKPQFVEDSIYVDTLAATWPYKYDLSKMFIDEDEGDSVIYKVNFVHSSMEAEIVGDTLVVTPVNATKLKEGIPYRIIIAAYDAAGDSSLSKVAFFIGEKPAAIGAIANAPKATWQSAISAARGTVAIFDMQGRVMWKQTLPASEAEVRAIMQKTSGNAILRVNKQTWMLNKKTVK